MRENILDELDLLMTGIPSWRFNRYGRVYFQTNEILKEYISGLDNKSVLSVSASGDQLLNCVYAGARIVDTFDINYFSNLYQNLKICAVKYLSDDDLICFLNSFSYDIYKKFSKWLDLETRYFFDYLYGKYDVQLIFNRFFFINFTSSKNDNCFIYKNNYIDGLNKLRSGVCDLSHKHYHTDIYDLPKFLNCRYDAIFLSNISSYCKDPVKFFYFLKQLSSDYLNSDGLIYYAYNYECQFSNPMMAIRSINSIFDASWHDLSRDVVSNTEIINIECQNLGGSGYGSKDSVLVLHK